MTRFTFRRFKILFLYAAVIVVVLYSAYSILTALSLIDWTVQRKNVFAQAWNLAFSREGSVYVTSFMAIFVLVTFLVDGGLRLRVT